jgi:hypothetical protein
VARRPDALRARAIGLAAICSIPSFGIAKFVKNAWSPDTNKNTNKTDGCSEYTSAYVLKNALKFRFAAAKFYVWFQCAAKKQKSN